MPYFVVHEHHASRLHFDFRLELDGVLKSWAVPKGPSMNPVERRLAILVEDHPLDYGNFEGTIPEGQYGAGRVLIWDRGEYKLLSGGVDSEKMEFSLRGKRLRGIFVLARLRKKEREWLLIKKKDGLENPAFRLKPVLQGHI